MLSAQQTTKKINEKTEPRITEEGINDRIACHQFVYVGLLTICVITLKSGFTVTGESACVSVGNYDREIGESLAYKQAFSKIWQLEGYLLAEHITSGRVTEAAADIPPDSMGAPIYKG